MITLLTMIHIDGLDGSPDHTIVVGEEGAYACLSLDGDQITNGWEMATSTGVLVVTPNQFVVIFTDEHDVMATCDEDDLLDVDEVDQSQGLWDLPLLLDALGDLRRERANCPYTCGE